MDEPSSPSGILPAPSSHLLIYIVNGGPSSISTLDFLGTQGFPTSSVNGELQIRYDTGKVCLMKM